MAGNATRPICHKHTVLLAVLSLSGCTHSAIKPETSDPVLPSTWVRQADQGTVELNWLKAFSNPQLTALVTEAVNNNYLLERERARLAQAEQAVVVARADRFPELDLSLSGSRRGIEGSDGTRISSNSFSATLDAGWEVDLWGRLNKQQQSVQLAMAAQQARLQLAERELAASTASALFRVMEAQQLLEVAERRLANAIQAHDIVASGYRQGLNDALDLYLARNQVERQEASVAERTQTVSESIADLQLALARYPDGRMQIAGTLPIMNQPIPAGLPSELVTRRADIQEAWLNLLAADAELAAAHKSRFPRLTLVGSGGATTLEFADLLDGNGTTWTVLGGLSQPLFTAGRLAALEEQAAQRVRQAEQEYLSLVFNAFADVENAVSRSAALQTRYASFIDAEKNASAALELALEQYQRGLVAYTTVLESQRQAFDAEATVVELQNLLLQNRIALYLALGGEFSTDY